jgi:hypothetical protein
MRLSLVREKGKRESWRQSTTSPKLCILVLVMHTACSPNASGLEMLLGISDLGKRITTALVV